MSNVLDLTRWPESYRKIPYGKVGYGYMVDPLDPLHIIPNEENIILIEQAFDYLEKGASLREASEWLGQKLLKSINHATLSNLYNRHRKPWMRGKKTDKRQNKHKMSRETKKLIAARHTANAAKRKADKIAESLKKKIPVEEYETPPEPKVRKVLEVKTVPDLPPEVEVIFQPNPGPQTEFLSSNESEILYGGAAGGGKSYAMLADPMRFFDNPNFVGLLLRRTNDELNELKRESQKLYPKAFPEAVWKQKDSMWKFPSGAEFWMSYLDRDDDVLRYQGQSFCWIGVDELTQYPSPYAWNYLKSRLRTTDNKIKPYLRMRATCNPGGPGHQWVKKMFVDPATPGKAFWAQDEHGEVISYPKNHEKAGQPIFKRRFIPAKLSDNKFLAEDGTYESNLLSLPEDQRRKLLDGDWSVVEGAAFPEFTQKDHVIDPDLYFPEGIPRDWRKFRCGDFGYNDATAVLWVAIDPMDGQLVVYRELYTRLKTGRDVAKMVLFRERDEFIAYGVLDTNVWRKTGQIGPSIAEEMIAEGCRWRPADKGQGSRSAGKNRLHELLKINPETGRPGIVFFNTCRQTISDLQSIPVDPDGLDDTDDRFRNDHTYDALRYGIMSRPKPGIMGFSDQNNYAPVDRRFGY